MKHPGGRPTIMTQETISKLEQAYAFGATDKEACFYANISHQTLYDYQKIHPEFVERKEQLKEQPILLARQSVIKQMKDDGDLALKFLERKKKDEFSLRQEADITSGGEKIAPIFGGQSAVQQHDSNQEDIQSQQEN